MKVSALKAGVVLGVALGLFHACWAALVFTGLAQPLMDWIFQLHFLSSPFEVQPFDAVTAATLVGVTGALGFVFGLLIGMVWNAMHRSKQPG